MLEKLLGIPGWFADKLWGWGARSVEAPEISPIEASSEVIASPRANAYLALEPEIKRFKVGGRVFGVHLSARNAFIVGGLHGPKEGLSESLIEFRTLLRSSGYRRMLLVPVAENELEIAQNAGFGAIQVASEAFLDPRTFELKGKHRAHLRQMCNRANHRYGLEVREIDPTDQARQDWEKVYTDWLAHQPKGHEMKLLVGTPNLDTPFMRRYFAAFEPRHNRAVSAISIVPGWNGRGYGVDIMSRAVDAPAGAMDLLMTETIVRLGEEGREIFSLGASPMAIHLTEPHAGTPRYLRWFMAFLFHTALGNKVFGFKNLYRFKNKFAPDWRPVFLAGWPKMGFWSMYSGGRMWGLFD